MWNYLVGEKGGQKLLNIPEFQHSTRDEKENGTFELITAHENQFGGIGKCPFEVLKIFSHTEGFPAVNCNPKWDYDVLFWECNMHVLLFSLASPVNQDS